LNTYRALEEKNGTWHEKLDIAVTVCDPDGQLQVRRDILINIYDSSKRITSSSNYINYFILNYTNAVPFGMYMAFWPVFLPNWML